MWKAVGSVVAAAESLAFGKLAVAYEMMHDDRVRALGERSGGRKALEKAGKEAARIAAAVATGGWSFVFGGRKPTSEDQARAEILAAFAGMRAASAAALVGGRWAASLGGLASPSINLLVEIQWPFVEAFEQGLWLHWITPEEVIAVGRKPLPQGR